MPNTSLDFVLSLSVLPVSSFPGSTIKDMKHKTGCNMWVDQRALKLTITGPDLAAVEHAAKSVDAYVAAAPIKAGAVEAAVTKTLECPGHLLDMLGDRTTIARIVKETHAQVVVNKKIGRIIVRGDHRSVELACSSVQTTIQAALHGGMGLRVNTPDGGYVGSGGGGSSSSVGPGISSLGIGGTSSGLSPNNMGGMFHRMVQTQSPHSPDHMSVMDIHELHNVQTWGLHDHTHHVIQHPRHNHHTRDVRGSDTDESEIETETVSLGSIGVRTPVSSTAGSPRGAPQPSLTTSPASITGSTPRGDWSLFSGGFGLGMAALHEGSSSASTPTTVTATRTTPRVHFPEGIQSMTATDLRECEEGKDEVPGVIGSSAPPPSPASTTSAGDLTRRARGALVDACALDALEASDDEEGEDIEDKVARLGKRLQAMGLGKYCDKFAENEVDLEALGLMSEGDLADIGIPKGPRLKILNAVGRGPSHTA